MVNWTIYYNNDDLLHYNQNHDPKTGQFAPGPGGSGKLKGINRPKYMNPDGTLTAKGQKKYGKYRNAADREIKYLQDHGHTRKVRRQVIVVGPGPYAGFFFMRKRWYADALKKTLQQSKRYHDAEYTKKISDALYHEKAAKMSMDEARKKYYENV